MQFLFPQDFEFFSADNAERSLILAESAGIQIISAFSAEEMLFFCGNAGIAHRKHHPAYPVKELIQKEGAGTGTLSLNTDLTLISRCTGSTILHHP